ncbi:MAG TPA: FkbM family methyltransferase [Opitutaceae bacterium]|nr:FkbM family methyltransferase [Opitutaceae bacterium]
MVTSRIPQTYSHPAEQSFALNELDLKLKPYLNFNGGFFVEAGSHDGISQSNSLYFERFRNWKGVLIEPVPELAAKCKENRPSCIVEDCALVPLDYQKQTIDMYFCGLMSLVKGAQKTTEADLEHVRIGCHVQGIESYALTVKARTLTSILDQYAVPEIDLLSLDVEGYELNALRGLDFEKYRPAYLLIESRFREEIDRFLASGYEPIAELSHHDVLFKSKKRIQEESQISITTPVAFFIFKRPAQTERVFDRIAQVKPATLLLIADGPRSREEAKVCAETRQIVDRIDWDCRVFRNFSDENLGCKHRVSTGLDWVFSQVKEAIILEDDCLPALSFFLFCQTLLEHYRDDERICAISGDNFQFGRPRTDDSYYFSRYPHCWGWASWKRAWKHFDLAMTSWPTFKAKGIMESVFEHREEYYLWSWIFDQNYAGKINSWAYPWTYACLSQSALTILPDVNLVSNIGFGVDSTHSTDSRDPLASLPIGEVWHIKHPEHIIRHKEADTFTFENVYDGYKRTLTHSGKLSGASPDWHFVKSLNQWLPIYLDEAKKLRNNVPKDFEFWPLIRDFLPWYLSQNPNATSMIDQVPWLTYGAISFLKRILRKEMRIFEYGAGGSTVFFARRAEKIFTCEHDPRWAMKVKEALDKLDYENYEIKVVKPVPDQESIYRDAADPDGYVSTAAEYKGLSFESYAKSILEFPDKYFHVILIDGRARPSCAKHAISKVAEKGYIILDNAERAEYSAVHDMLNNAGYRKKSFYGPGPRNRYFWLTCVWQHA